MFFFLTKDYATPTQRWKRWCLISFDKILCFLFGHFFGIHLSSKWKTLEKFMRQYVWMLHTWKTTEELKKVVDSMQKRQPLCNFNLIFTSTFENFWFGRVVFLLLFWFLSWCHIMSLNAPKFLDHVHGSFKIVLERNREVCFLFDCQLVIS